MYETILELKEALEGCDISSDKILTFIRVGTLYIYNSDVKGPVFIGEYGNRQACEDVRTALGIDSPLDYEKVDKEELPAYRKGFPRKNVKPKW